MEWASTATEQGVALRLPRTAAAADAEVGLWCDLDLGPTRFRADPQGWELLLDELPVDRLEYLITVNGEYRLDPTNPRVVPGVFGPHSWLPLPGYHEPDWMQGPRADGVCSGVESIDTAIGPVEVMMWQPAGSTPATSLPLLISHDGPEMAAYGGLLEFAAAGIAAGTLPPLRIALASPGPRDERYAANPAYSAALTERVIGHLTSSCATIGRPVLIGQSLGGLAALHAAWTAPSAFAGIGCQSGSFFTPRTDSQESGYSHWDQVTEFVAEVLAAERPVSLPPVALGCGSAEENFANNTVMRDHLLRLGVDTSWEQVRDGHTWTCWRDLLDPVVTGLIKKVWS